MACGGEAMICTSVMYNGKTVLKPFAFSIKEPNLTFAQLINNLCTASKIEWESQRFSQPIEVTDKTKTRIFCGKELESCDVEVNISTVRSG